MLGNFLGIKAFGSKSCPHRHLAWIHLLRAGPRTTDFRSFAIHELQSDPRTDSGPSCSLGAAAALSSAWASACTQHPQRRKREKHLSASHHTPTSVTWKSSKRFLQCLRSCWSRLPAAALVQTLPPAAAPAAAAPPAAPSPSRPPPGPQVGAPPRQQAQQAARTQRQEEALSSCPPASWLGGGAPCKPLLSHHHPSAHLPIPMGWDRAPWGPPAPPRATPVPVPAPPVPEGAVGATAPAPSPITQMKGSSSLTSGAEQFTFISSYS